ncbi:MAG: Holliday junction branch migration protein RuvA [Chitinophagaceae bacterium]|nr:MAG: Holliday junction branch migration protein RuvA [Chitinophagaceae bacterium]
MIAFLKGDFVRKTPASVYVDVAGVGYEAQISLHTYSAIQDLEKGILYTHLLVREDAHILYGFADEGERELFRMLIGVTGVGAGTARVMLSYLKPDELGRAIANGDARQLERVKGIGRKTAERIVLELREKLVKNPVETGGAVQNISPWKGNSLETDALNALVALGIARAAADAAVRKVVTQNPDLGVEDVIKKALQAL